MRKSLRSIFEIFLSTLLVCAGADFVQAQPRAVESDQQILLQLEHEWNEAFYRKDVGFIRRVLADEFIATYEDGTRVDKNKELAATESFNQQVDSAVQDDFTIRVYGDTAVVWFTLHLVGPKQGKPTAIALQYVDVFVFRDGRWQCVSSQSTKVAGN